MPRTINFFVTEEFSGKTVEHYLRDLHGFSSGLLRTLKQRDNGMLLGGEHVRTVDRLKKGDLLTVNIPDDDEPAPPSPILVPAAYEDEDVIVLDKPAFMPVHPTRNHQGDTLANAFAHRLAQRGRSAAFRAINRLDRDTTGLVVAGLNSYSACRLSGNVEKEYCAVVHGVLRGEGTISLPIRRRDPLLIFREVGEGGEPAITHWRTVAGNESLTYLHIRLETGRTHQIRVHFSHLGYPLVGETLYAPGDELMQRQALHCRRVAFTSPVSRKPVCITSPLPEDMLRVVKTLSPIE